MRAGLLIAGAKGSSGISVRSLASEAGVAGSTITRIQAGTVDPTIGSVAHILEAAGYELVLTAVRRGSATPARLLDLADAWTPRPRGLRIDWTRWRSLLDHLALHPENVPEAIYPPPSPSGSIVIDALLAGVAEKLADDQGLRRPSWTVETPALREPFRPPVRPGVRLEVPSQLAERGLMIDTESLWRDRTTVGV